MEGTILEVKTAREHRRKTRKGYKTEYTLFTALDEHNIVELTVVAYGKSQEEADNNFYKLISKANEVAKERSK